MAITWSEILDELRGLAIVKFEERRTPKSFDLIKRAFPGLDFSRSYTATEAQRLACCALVDSLRAEALDAEYVLVELDGDAGPVSAGR